MSSEIEKYENLQLDEENAVHLEFGAETKETMEKNAEFDDEYGDECGYSLIVAFRGRSAGRQLKRNILKLGLFHYTCGFTLIVLTMYANTHFTYSPKWTDARFGASIMSLMWLTAFDAGFFMTLTAVMLKYWGSLMTNRGLVLSVMRVTLLGLLFHASIMTWCLGVYLSTFQKTNWNKDEPTKAMLPTYVMSLVCFFPYILAIIMYSMDIHYLLEEVDMDAEILEPNTEADNQNVMDFSNFTLLQLAAFTCVSPLILVLQIWDFIQGIIYAVLYHCNDFRSILYARATRKRRVKKSTLARIRRTVGRHWRDFKDWLFKSNKIVVPEPDENVALEALRREQDEADEVEKEQLRERIRKEAEEEREGAELAQREAEARMARLEVEKIAREEQEQKEKLERAPTLAVQQYKALWSSLGTSGSFQCKLKAPPVLLQFAEHMKSQGFHVVFASSPNSVDCELGICNNRGDQGGPWFLARFLASQKSFSAVMKSQDPDSVTAYVKKFALAKVLKIDTSK